MSQNYILTALTKSKNLRNEDVYSNFITKAKNKLERMGTYFAELKK